LIDIEVFRVASTLSQFQKAFINCFEKAKQVWNTDSCTGSYC